MENNGIANFEKIALLLENKPSGGRNDYIKFEYLAGVEDVAGGLIQNGERDAYVINAYEVTDIFVVQNGLWVLT